jgi:hypothetical protein
MVPRPRPWRRLGGFGFPLAPRSCSARGPGPKAAHPFDHWPARLPERNSGKMKAPDVVSERRRDGAVAARFESEENNCKDPIWCH